MLYRFVPVPGHWAKRLNSKYLKLGSMTRALQIRVLYTDPQKIIVGNIDCSHYHWAFEKAILNQFIIKLSNKVHCKKGRVQ